MAGARAPRRRRRRRCSRPRKAQGLEGIIAKRLDCPYTPGRRANGWVKVKNIRRTDAVIGGWLPGEGGRSGKPRRARRSASTRTASCATPGAWARLHRGRARAARRRCWSRSRARTARSTGRQPPKVTRFVEPRLVCVVDYSEVTNARDAAPAVLQGAARRPRARAGGLAGRPSAPRAARRRPRTRRRSACAPSSRYRSR